MQLMILEAEAHLIEVSEAPEPPGEGVAPKPGGALPTTKPGDAMFPANSIDELVVAAKKSYESVLDETVQSLVAPPRLQGQGEDTVLKSILNSSRAELFYLWSRRWMDAQRDQGGGTKAAEVAAIEGHLGRMKDLERGQIFEVFAGKPERIAPTKEQLAEVLKMIPEFQTAIKFYRIEAEASLAKAKK
jgi:hypothetical protein